MLNEDKTRYAFAETNLLILLNERGIKEIHLVGVWYLYFTYSS